MYRTIPASCLQALSPLLHCKKKKKKKISLHASDCALSCRTRHSPTCRVGGRHAGGKTWLPLRASAFGRAGWRNGTGVLAAMPPRGLPVSLRLLAGVSCERWSGRDGGDQDCIRGGGVLRRCRLPASTGCTIGAGCRPILFTCADLLVVPFGAAASARFLRGGVLYERELQPSSVLLLPPACRSTRRSCVAGCACRTGAAALRCLNMRHHVAVGGLAGFVAARPVYLRHNAGAALFHVTSPL